MTNPLNNTQKTGVLPFVLLQSATHHRIIKAASPVPNGNYQPASLDLRLGNTAYSLQCSFLANASTVEAKLHELTIQKIDLRDGAVLERNRPYLIPLQEEFNLPEEIWAKANPKSSTGRLDIFTRLVTDLNNHFDTIPSGYKGPAYLEVFSRSFTIKLQTGICLNQVRLFNGDPRCNPGEVLDLHRQRALMFNGQGQPLEPGPTADNKASFSVLLNDGPYPIGYRAKRNSALLDISRNGAYDHREYWQPVWSDTKGSLILEPEEFYLLRASEAIAIPPGLAAEMTPYDTSSGELRTHYAGFFDPGFGYGDQGEMKGVQPVLEIRAHDVPFMVEENQQVSSLVFERMATPPHKWYGPRIGSSYQRSGRMLSKHFKEKAPTAETLS